MKEGQILIIPKTPYLISSVDNWWQFENIIKYKVLQ